MCERSSSWRAWGTSCACPAAWTCVCVGRCGTHAFWRKYCFVLSKGGGQSEHAKLAPPGQLQQRWPYSQETHMSVLHTHKSVVTPLLRSSWQLLKCLCVEDTLQPPHTPCFRLLNATIIWNTPIKDNSTPQSEMRHIFSCCWWIKHRKPSRNNFARGDCGAEITGCRKPEHNSETMPRKRLTYASNCISLYNQTDPMTYSWSHKKAYGSAYRQDKLPSNGEYYNWSNLI